MRALSLDYLNRGRPRPVAWLLAAGALAFACEVGMRYGEARETVARTEARLARYSAPPLEAAPRTPARPVSPEEYAAARDTARRLTTPWSMLFEALEGARVERVALLSIDPDFEQRTVSLSGEAKDYLAVLTYVASLGAQPGLSRVHLVRHEVQRNSPHRTIAFTVSAAWEKKP